MSKGPSGRIVIEIEPEIKEELYSALKKEKMTLKDWFLMNADVFLRGRSQMSLLPTSEDDITRKIG